MKYDQEKVTRLISELKKSQNLLKELTTLAEDAFLSDPHKVSSAKYNFIVAIESIIDISNHLISKNSFRVPEDYGDTFIVLAENNILPKDFANLLVKMARFRNRLVHLYWNIDANILFEIMQNNIKDFEIFLGYLKKAGI